MSTANKTRGEKSTDEGKVKSKVAARKCEIAAIKPRHEITAAKPEHKVAAAQTGRQIAAETKRKNVTRKSSRIAAIMPRHEFTAAKPQNESAAAKNGRRIVAESKRKIATRSSRIAAIMPPHEITAARPQHELAAAKTARKNGAEMKSKIAERKFDEVKIAAALPLEFPIAEIAKKKTVIQRLKPHYRCDFCDKILSFHVSSLKIHVLAIHFKSDVAKLSFDSCDVCKKGFKNPNSRYSHLLGSK